MMAWFRKKPKVEPTPDEANLILWAAEHLTGTTFTYYGDMPDGTGHDHVVRWLRELAEIRRAFHDP
jgi:hypothetical protein